MNLEALIWMTAVQLTVTSITIYFFWKVIKKPIEYDHDGDDDNE